MNSIHITVADFVVANDIRSGTLIPLLSEFTSNLDEPIFALYQPQCRSTPK